MKRIVSILLALALVLGFSLVVTTPVAAATPIYVDASQPDDTGVGTSWATAKKYIQSGINIVDAGGTVNVADGTYTITSAITVDKGLTITGNTGSPSSVLVTYAAPQSTNNGFEIGAADITIQGIKVVNCKHGFFFDRNNTTYTGCTITHCAVETASGWGIGEIATPSTTISYNTITDCGDKGIYVRNCESGSVATRTQIIGNTISGCGQSCIQTYHSKYVYIYNNTINAAEDKGINVIRSSATGTSDRIQVIGNTISETKWQGIQVIGAPYTYVYDNTLTKCNYYGSDNTGDWDYASIHVQDDIGPTYSDHTIIDGNTVTDGINGIQIWSDDCQVICNEVYDMGLTYADTKVVGGRTYNNSGILIGSNWGSGDIDPTGTVIQCNNIHDNYWGLFYSADLTIGVTAENNWWGAADGPSGAGSGSGDAVSANVDYDPWVTASSIATATGTGTASFAAICGSISGLTSVAEGTLPTAGKPNLAFPHGFFSFDITGLTPGQIVTVVITLPSAAPVGTEYWKYHPNTQGGWVQIPMGSDDGDNVITITLVDGGLGDDDGAVDGTIEDQGGPGNPGPVGWDTYPVNKMRVLLPWIALLAAIMAGASLLVLRRRRAQS